VPVDVSSGVMLRTIDGMVEVGARNGSRWGSKDT